MRKFNYGYDVDEVVDALANGETVIVQCCWSTDIFYKNYIRYRLRKKYNLFLRTKQCSGIEEFHDHPESETCRRPWGGNETSCNKGFYAYASTNRARALWDDVRLQPTYEMQVIYG
jgi:hypothetical protein